MIGSEHIAYLTGAVRLTRLALEEKRMAREYLNLPTMLDALEDEMDREAASVASAARSMQNRGLGEIKRAHGAIKAKGAALDRLKAFADNMEARNMGNAPPDQKLGFTNGADSSTTSPDPVGAKPSETAHLGETK